MHRLDAISAPQSIPGIDFSQGNSHCPYPVCCIGPSLIRTLAPSLNIGGRPTIAIRHKGFVELPGRAPYLAPRCLDGTGLSECRDIAARSERRSNRSKRLPQVADLQPLKFDALAPLHKGAHIGQRERADRAQSAKSSAALRKTAIASMRTRDAGQRRVRCVGIGGSILVNNIP